MDAGELARFAAALPSWIRQSLDALPPDAARERLRLIYRSLWPDCAMPADIPPWSGSADRADGPATIEPGPPRERPPGPPPPPDAPGNPF